MASIPSLDADRLAPNAVRLSPISLRTPEPGAKSVLTASVSVAAHALVLGVVLVLPLLTDDSLPERATGVKAFFASPLELASPPPPPPAAASAAPRVRAQRPVSTDAFTAPIEVPEQIALERGIDLGVDGGASGGVEGGVPGGVVGGIVGGLPEVPRPPVQPQRVGGVIKEPKKIKDVTPVYPELAVSSRVQGVVILECLLDTRGHVQEARVLRGVPLLDQAALDAVRQWVYSVTLVDGVPAPVILTVTVNFQLR
jgi:protein TonB